MSNFKSYWLTISLQKLIIHIVITQLREHFIGAHISVSLAPQQRSANTMWPLMIVPLLVNLTSAKLQCPDGRLCPEQSTCCKLESGNYDCCPVEKRSQSDDSGDFSPLSWKTHSIPVESKILEMEAGARSSSVSSDSSIHCDYTHYCPDGWACCKMLTGSWSCCPHLTTVCCYQGTRCCPRDNAGNLSPSSMALKYHSIPMKSKTLETEEKALSTTEIGAAVHIPGPFVAKMVFTVAHMAPNAIFKG
ncbi:hypothetical protein scyTo_0017081 [Scyliorhinus torazame]|uniref:Granulins domain-containing protein n=1 Tax=Scyliorhinus torazame TaxID=75743 RepID=A0A401Q400_SCYTO|nr:hypothetical protein [Scyliorhinus torazame]